MTTAFPFLLLSAAVVMLEWDQHPDPDVTGFRLYGPELPMAVFGHDQTNMALTNLPAGHYLFYLTATTDDGRESKPSNIVEYDVPTNGVAAPLGLHGLPLSITWTATTNKAKLLVPTATIATQPGAGLSTVMWTTGWTNLRNGSAGTNGLFLVAGKPVTNGTPVSLDVTKITVDPQQQSEWRAK